jgi:hypothetical protein
MIFFKTVRFRKVDREEKRAITLVLAAPSIYEART